MSSLQPQKQQRSFPKKLRRVLLATTLVASPWLYGIPAMAKIAPILQSPAPAGEVILNKATGSFIDTDSTEKAIESNVVQVTVAEIAGVTVTATGTSGTPNPGQTVYFNYTITNFGNDPTQFFIPALGTLTGKATQPSNIQITGYSIDGTSLTDLSASPITVPNGGGQTGRNSGGTAGLLKTPNPNGEFQPNGYITVRIPVLIDATGVATGDIVTAQLGDTPVDSASTATPKARQQNIAYNNSNTVTNRVYTVDDADALSVTNEATGNPFNGDTTNHRQEASAIAQLSIIVPPVNVSGNVFEDPNYGGGAGRPLSTSGVSLVDGATVELYKSDGSYVSNTTTSGGGNYTFTGVIAGDYYIRVVNSTVKSVRPGTIAGLLPVQTFRVNDSTGTSTNDTARVGGENPSVADTGAAATGAILNTTNFTFAAGAGSAPAGAQAQSIAPVKVGSTAVTGIDFGYNFDTIVNTNATGQGSLNQFITNSNTLHGEATLAQTNQVSGKETSIFMISDGLAHPGLKAGLTNLLATSGANKGAAVISPTLHYVISDSDTSLDGRTQSTNIGDTNTGSPIGTGGTVGVDALNLDKVPRPEIVIDFSAVPVNTNGIQVTGANALLAGLAVYGYHPSQNVANTPLLGMIYVLPAVTDSGKTTITQLLVGTSADGTEPNIPLPRGAGIVTHGGTVITNNYIAYNGDGLYFANYNGTHATATDNEITQNGPKDNSSNEASGDYADNIETDNNTSNFTLQGNFVHDPSSPPSISANTQGQGIQISSGSSNGILDNNTFDHNRRFGINSAGIDITITKNIVKNTVSIPAAPTQGSGININDGMLRNRISQNSLYNNLTLGINLSAAGVTPNDGTLAATKANNGMDYPIITSSVLTSGTLSVKGFVGSNPAGNAIFANATLEFFIADDDGNQNGEVILGDLKSKPHGEGKTYIGTCTADANGLFGTASSPCDLTNAGTLGITAATATVITATATDSAGNTSEFSAPAVSNPNVLLVKRITAVNGNTTNGSVSLNSYDPDLSVGGYPYDKNVIVSGITPPTTNKWPGTTGASTSTFLLGARDGGVTKPNDEVEYTIYFLSAGNSAAQNVQLCDRLPVNQAFIPNSYNFLPPGPGVAPSVNADRGIALSYNGAYESYTNVNDTDVAQYYQPGQVPLPSFCATAANPNINANPTGAVVINLGAGATNAIGGSLPNASAPGTPTTSYGFVRFKVKNVLP